MSSIPYLSPRIYNLWQKIVEREREALYRKISKLIGKNKKVFELGSGPGFLYFYLQKGCTYIGWDLNKRFVSYAQKRGIKVERKDIFNFKEYPESDVIVICNLLHHIFPKDKILIKKALKKTKKLIVLEPYRISRVDFLPYFVFYLYDKIIGDNDGINNFSERREWKFTDLFSLKEYFKKMGARKIYVLRKSKKVLAIFENKNYERKQN